MGLSPSKQVAGTLISSPEFAASCTTVYNQSLSSTFSGIPRYQIASAADRLYQTLHLPLIDKWVTSPPTRSQIDKSLKRTVPPPEGDGIVTLGESEFKDFAVDLYTAVIVSNAEKAVLVKVVSGVGVVVRSGVMVVGTLVGVYAVGVATAVYLSFGG
ncbi:uncharacterized protein LOC143613187 [Bidens hawaiensis]|uniref:uncharacterized protein LOC143613187 n=1 Tax=Bidens hawaiensis TaxID=980011 RepID=UPI004049762C